MKQLDWQLQCNFTVNI